MTSSWRSPLDPERVTQVAVTHWQRDEALMRDEQVTVEEPLELRIAHRSLAIIMRTPGHDRELAMGFLLTEGVVSSPHEVLTLEEEADEDGLPLANVLNVTLRNEHRQEALQAQPVAFERHFAVSASCGLCGKNSIADLMTTTPPLSDDTSRFSYRMIYELALQLRAKQTVFQHTGGLHAAAIFNAHGDLLLAREDIGRHNAVDKLIGYAALHNTFPYTDCILLVSGRTSFEILQKALLARIPCVAAISAPSSLAVELAEGSGITLIGFLRDSSMNVYTHPQRIV